MPLAASLTSLLERAQRALEPVLRPFTQGWRWELLFSLLVLIILAYSWMFAEISVPNERSRVYLTVAMVEHQTLTIDEPMARWGPIYDRAFFEGHHYTDKAPGSSLLAVVPYMVARTLVSDFDQWTIAQLINLMRTWLMLPFALWGVWVLRRLLRHLDFDDPLVDVVTLAWILGSAASHYSAAFYGHQIVAVMLLTSLWCLLIAIDAGTSLPKRIAAASMAGLSAGLAGLTEYQAGIPCVALTLWLIAQRGGRRVDVLVPFALAVVPCLMVFGWYHQSAFGGPLELSYHHLVDPRLREIHEQGVGGVRAPEWKYFKASLTSLHRGLLTSSPFFLLVPYGCWRMWQVGQRGLMVLCAVTLAGYLFMISGTEAWFGGWSFGPRLLVPAMAWTMIPVAFALHALRRTTLGAGLTGGLVFVGMAYCQMVRMVFPEVPDNAKNPLVDFLLPALRADVVSPNLSMKYADVAGAASLEIALFLVMIAMAVMAWRSVAELVRGQRRIALVLMMAVMTPLLLAILYRGPSVPPHDTHGFVGWMKQMTQRNTFR